MAWRGRPWRGRLRGGPRPRRWRKWQTGAWLVIGLVCATLATLAVAAARYQPVSNGDDEFRTLAFPGMPTGHGIRQVNTFGNLLTDLYIPPQRGTFSISGTITNTGTHPVTIVSAAPPTGLGLAQSGPPRYAPLGPPYSSAAPFSNSRPLHDLVLQPGQEVLVGFPVHMWPCAPAEAVWYSVTDFTVTTRYLTFTHTVQVPFGPDSETLIMRGPGGQPGQKDVICAPGTTKANLPRLPPRDPGPQPVAGTIIRVYQGRNTGELRLIQMTAPDAAAGRANRVGRCADTARVRSRRRRLGRGSARMAPPGQPARSEHQRDRGARAGGAD